MAKTDGTAILKPWRKMAGVEGIEPPSQVLETRILATVLHPLTRPEGEKYQITNPNFQIKTVKNS